MQPVIKRMIVCLSTLQDFIHIRPQWQSLQVTRVGLACYVQLMQFVCSLFCRRWAYD